MEIIVLRRFSGIVGVLILLASSIYYSLFPEMIAMYLPAFVVGAAIVLYAVAVHRKFILGLLKGKAVKYSANSMIYIMIVLSTLALINFISFRNHKRIDTTESKAYSLTPQSQQILKDLNEPVSIYAFYRTNNPRRNRFERLLRLYRYHSNFVQYEIIDPVEQPGLIREKGIKQEELGKKIDGLALIERGGRQVRVFNANEQGLTNAIVEASRKTRKVIYFVQGHGEKDLQATGGRGLSLVRSLLESEYYEVKNLFMRDDGKIPDDCTVLVIAGPVKRLFDYELSALQDLLKRGGRMLFLLDPGSDSGISEVISKVGLRFHNNYIIDPQHNYLGDSLNIAVFSYSDHKITRGWNNKFFTIFPVVSSVEWYDISDPRLFNDNIAKTSRYSWGDTNPDDRTFDSTTDASGPLTVASLAFKKLLADEVEGVTLQEGEEREFRVVLVGDSDFITDNYLQAQTNENFFLNIINWLAQEEELVSIRERTISEQSFMLSKKEILVIFYSVLSLPILIVIAGIVVWLRRRTL